MKTCFLILGLFLIVNCASVSNAISDKNRFDGDFLKATYLYNQGKYETALELLKNINRQVEDPYIVTKIANIYLNLKKYADAKVFLNDAVKSERLKDNPEINFLLGRLYVEQMKNTVEALKYLQKAVDNSENKTFYGEYLAGVLESTGDFASAIKIYSDLLKNNPNADYYFKRGSLFIKLGLTQKGVDDLLMSDNVSANIRAKLLLADVFQNENQLEKAEHYLSEVLKTHNFLTSVKIKLADIYKLMGNNEKMVSILEDVKNSFSGEEKLFILKQLANAYLNSGDYSRAIEKFEIYLMEKPDDTQALFFMGYLYESKGDIDKAIEYYTKTVKIRDDYAEAYKRIAYIFYNKKDYSRAISFLNNVKQSDKDTEYYRLKTILYLNLEQFENGEKNIEEGLKRFPDSEELLFTKAVIKEKQNDHESVISLMKRLLELDSENPTYLNYLGYLYADLNMELETSYELIKKALNMEPENSAFLDSMAWVLYRLGKFQEAFQYQKKALKISPEEEEMRQHMEAILKSLGLKKSVEDVIKE